MSVKTLSKTDGMTSVLSNFFEPWSDWFNDGLAGKKLTLPNVNISEHKDNYSLSMAAPGLHKKDFRIDIDGNILTISGHKEENKEENKGRFARQEFNYSSFSRSFTLPEEVEHDKIDASYDGGILSLTLPKNEKASRKNRKEIQVK